MLNLGHRVVPKNREEELASKIISMPPVNYKNVEKLEGPAKVGTVVLQ